MDIAYLLLLQDFRNATGDALTPFLESVSLFAVTYLIMIPTFVYWAIGKRDGLYVLATTFACGAVNAVVKLTACVYRPWIRDPRILPAGDAITTATGYSFPSGHTVTAGPLYGGMSATLWRRNRPLAILGIAMILLTAFSRNYLGVHTPQDVLVGLIESVFWIFCMGRIFRHLEEHPEREVWFLLAGILFGVVAIVYETFKPYPMDYVDGKLLVDPDRMMNDGYGDVAFLIGFCVARLIERTWVRFEPSGIRGVGLATSVCGLVPMWFLMTTLGPLLDGVLGAHWGHFCNNFILANYIIVLYPAIIKRVCGSEALAA